MEKENKSNIELLKKKESELLKLISSDETEGDWKKVDELYAEFFKTKDQQKEDSRKAA